MNELREYLLSLARRNDIDVTNIETDESGADLAPPFIRKANFYFIENK